MTERTLMNRLMRAATVSGAVVLLGGVSLYAQAPRYQSPIMAPAAPSGPALPVAAAITPNGTVVEDVVVRVNDQIISQSDVERAQDQLTAEIEQTHASPADAAERQKNMLRDMIDQQLLISKGKELGINPDAEVIRRLDEIRKSNHFDTLEDLEKAARAQGVSYEDFKAGIRNSVITQQVVRDEVGRRIQMTQAQETVYYDAHKQDLLQPEQVRLAEILIATPADATEAQVAASQARADEVTAKLKADGKFEDLAKQYSTGPAAAQGGELGMYKPGALGKVLEDATFPLPVGGVTAPIRTRQGFVILKVLEHQKAGVPPMKDVEQEIQNALYNESMAPALRAYLTKAREDAYVDIRPGYVDSGASPKQTKPIFSAYAPPAVKKKKAQQDKSRYDGEFRRASVGANKSDSDGSAAPGTVVPPKTASAALPSATAAGTTTATAATKSTTAAAGLPDATARPASARRVSSRTGKPKKVRREKIRYGQAPRNALPSAPEDVAIAIQPAGPGPGAPAGGLGMAGNTPAVNAGVNAEDPLTPVAAKVQKSRYSSRAPEVKLRRTKVKVAKAVEKAKATPVSMTTEEKATQKTQSSALGLSGDTTKKKKKKKKGDPKERLQEKPAEPKTDKFANPTGPGTSNDLSKTPVAGDTTHPAPKKSADSTTLPSTTAPAPGSPVAPTVPGSTTPAAGSTTPAGTPQ